MKEKSISIIVPVYNEHENVPIILDRIINEISELKYQFTLLFVDDGSDDKVLSFLTTSNTSGHINVEVLTLTRNFGHQAALAAGLNHGAFDAYISMDGDLQHPPSLLKDLIYSWENGNQVVQTLRISELKQKFLKKIFSDVFYKFFRIGSSFEIKSGSSDFRLLDRKVVNVINSIPERTKVLRALLPVLGFKTAYIKFIAETRFKGTSKYSIKKMIKLAYLSFLSYSRIPIYAALFISFTLILSTVVFSVFILYERIFLNIYVPGQASILLTNLFTSFVVLISQSLIFIHVRKIHDQLQGIPPYVIDSSVTINAKGNE
jgi:dolichol-phosphate mannosyltransferase